MPATLLSSPEVNGTGVPMPVMSTQSNAGPPASSLSTQRYPNRSGPPLPSTPGRGSVSPLPNSIGSYCGTEFAVSSVPTTKLRSLPPRLWSVSVCIEVAGMGSVSVIAAGCGSTSGAMSPVPLSVTMLDGESGSLLETVSVAGNGVGVGGLNETNTSAWPSGGTLNEVWSTPYAGSLETMLLTTSASVPVFWMRSSRSCGKPVNTFPNAIEPGTVAMSGTPVTWSVAGTFTVGRTGSLPVM